MASKTEKQPIIPGALNLLSPGDKVQPGGSMLLDNWRVDQNGELRSRQGSGIEAANIGSGVFHTIARAGNDRFCGVGTELFWGAAAGTLVASGFDGNPLGIAFYDAAGWVMNRGNIRKIQALETTGGILFQQSQYFPSAGSVDISPVGNTGLKLLGYPLDESPSMPTAGTSHIEIATLFAPQTYIIVDRIGMNIELVPQLWATGMLPVGNRGVFAMWRNHAAPLIADSGRSLYYLT